MTAISLDLSTDRSLLNGLIDLEKDFPKKVLRGITRKVLPPLERKLYRVVQVYPPARNANSPKFVWSTDPEANARGRKGFFRRFPNGYTRTGQLRKDWRTDIQLLGNVITIEAINDNEGASWVYGDEDRGQVPGHITTGWFHIAIVIADVGIEVENEIQAFGDELLDTL